MKKNQMLNNKLKNSLHINYI